MSFGLCQLTEQVIPVNIFFYFFELVCFAYKNEIELCKKQLFECHLLRSERGLQQSTLSLAWGTKQGIRYLVSLTKEDNMVCFPSLFPISFQRLAVRKNHLNKANIVCHACTQLTKGFYLKKMSTVPTDFESDLEAEGIGLSI